jgi:hypothetical protein
VDVFRWKHLANLSLQMIGIALENPAKPSMRTGTGVSLVLIDIGHLARRPSVWANFSENNGFDGKSIFESRAICRSHLVRYRTVRAD